VTLQKAREKRFRRDSEKGATLVEFAFVFPLLMLLLFGIIEFGRLITTFVTVSTASREGARYGTAIGVGPNGVPQYIDCTGITDAALAKAVIGGLNVNDITVVWDTGPGSPPTVIADCDNATATPAPTETIVQSGHRVSVTVDKQFTTFIPLISNFIGSLNLSSTDNRTIFKGILSG
jgi:Flp pilus assembly protein TadG